MRPRTLNHVDKKFLPAIQRELLHFWLFAESAGCPTHSRTLRMSGPSTSAKPWTEPPLSHLRFTTPFFITISQ